MVHGIDRVLYSDAVWDMLVLTYKAIGVPHRAAAEILTNYPVWNLYIEDGVPIAFELLKATPFGFKSGAGGSDGSAAGRGEVKRMLTRTYHMPGRYSEVSHKIEDIVLQSGAPVVCASAAAHVLGKKIDILDDGMHYRRNITGVGIVRKILVGRPKGVPTTSYTNPQCPVEDPRVLASHDDGGSIADAAHHIACILGW